MSWYQCQQLFSQLIFSKFYNEALKEWQPPSTFEEVIILIIITCSKAASASSKALFNSSFSSSNLLHCFSTSWRLRPPSPSCSRRSLISRARFLFSLRLVSSCSVTSSRAARTRNSSDEQSLNFEMFNQCVALLPSQAKS